MSRVASDVTGTESFSQSISVMAADGWVVPSVIMAGSLPSKVRLILYARDCVLLHCCA